MPPPTDDLLAERGKTHGSFAVHAQVTQDLKAYFYLNCAKSKLNPRQAEAIEMILHKLGRIAAGDPNFADHWHDIAGYARLGAQACDK